MGPGDLRQVLDTLPTIDDPRLVVGGGTFDDAGVVKLTDELALVQSVDFFTPIVDDPFDFGRIAAANALSDIYAMGAEPLTAMAVCAFPASSLPLTTLERILAGGLHILREDGVLPVGGHTVKGPELTYGLAVTGTVHPNRVLTNAGARPDDALVLTKPLGSGVLATALKRGELDEQDAAAMVELLATTNRHAAHVVRDHGAHALTDITGYGFLGHALEMALASQVDLHIDAARVPLMRGAHSAAEQGGDFGGLDQNRDWARQRTNATEIDPVTFKLLCDPQTSGGLLAAVPDERANDLIRACVKTGVPAAVVGRVNAGSGVARVTGIISPGREDLDPAD